MNHTGWFRRLAEQCPGWYITYTSGGGPPSGWYAVPINPPPSREERLAAWRHPHRIGAFKTPQALRAAMRQRYAAGDECETCLGPWEQCGHRQPEQDKS